MKKEKIHLEYLLNATSKNILWSAISTPTGLEDWFADKVISDDKIVEFHWGKTELRKAEIIAIRSFSFIRFRWQDDENERDYFEIKMTLKSATKLFSVLLASKRPLITELADKLRLKYPLLPTISPCPTMRLEAIRSIIPISCRRYPKSV